jgi:hypothetical protein
VHDFGEFATWQRSSRQAIGCVLARVLAWPRVCSRGLCGMGGREAGLACGKGGLPPERRRLEGAGFWEAITVLFTIS